MIGPKWAVPPKAWDAQIDWDEIHDPVTFKDKIAVHYGGGPNTAGQFSGVFAEEAGDMPPRPKWHSHPWLFLRWRTSAEYWSQIDKEEAVLRGWEAYHRGKGWRGLAYSYGLGQSGTLYRNRGMNATGAHYGSDDIDHDGVSENREALAVVFILGAGQEPSKYALRTFRKFRRWAQKQEMVADHLGVYGHQEIARSGGHSTACPGVPLMSWLTVKFKKWRTAI